MYTVSSAGRGESEELGDYTVSKVGRVRNWVMYTVSRVGRVRNWVMYTVSRAGRGERENLGDVHCIKGRERGEGESG